jgi:hypothetical protein
LTHIATLAEAIKIRWIKDIIQQKEGWASIFIHCAGRQYNAAMWQLDHRSLEKIKNRIFNANPFWSSIIEAWGKLVGVKGEASEFLNYSFESAWYIKNPNLKHLQPLLSENRCFLIRDLVDDSGVWFSYQEFKRIYNVQINFMDYMSLRNSVPRTWIRAIKELGEFRESRETVLVESLRKSEQVCKWAYKELIKHLKVKEPYKAKWSYVLNNIEENEWMHYHSTVFKCTKNTKLQAFQFKILHNILSTQKTLKLCKISETDKCAFCEQTVETIPHLLFNCPLVRSIWNELAEWLAPALDISDLITEKNILLGSFSNDLINLLLLVAKHYVYCCKFRVVIPNIIGLKVRIRQEYQIEKSIAIKDTNQFNKFNAKWDNISQLL